MGQRTIDPENVAQVFSRLKGNVRATAKELGISRSSVRRNLAPSALKKPLVGGTKEGTTAVVEKLPKGTGVKRYILTSAQNNTHVHRELLDNLEALAEYYGAQIIVGTYTYNQNAYGPKSVKKDSWRERAENGSYDKKLWYDPALSEYIKDHRIELAPGLVWCGEYNALPTNVNPLAGLESYTGRKSAIFPHAKLAMRSIATMQGEGVKLNYTTGTVTQRNYIQKREGVIAEFHHIYGALLVEVNSDGNWWVRQLNQDEGTGTLQDLHVLVQNGEIVSDDATVEAITYGDLHGTFADPEVIKVSQEMLDTLQPKYQFLHDVMEGAAVNPHQRKHNTNHEKFHTWLRGYHKLDNELVDTAKLLSSFDRKFAQIVIVDSNHDDAWVKRWLREYDYRKDPPNTEVFLKLQAYLYSQIRNGVTDEQSRARTAKPKFVRDINMIEYALREVGGYKSSAKFLKADESFLTCGRKIENGQHGHFGPGGRFGTPENLSKMGRKANTAHTHTTGIWNGLYVAGTSSKLRWEYAKGPTAWTHSHVVTYGNGKRTIVTIYNGKWRA